MLDYTTITQHSEASNAFSCLRHCFLSGLWINDKNWAISRDHVAQFWLQSTLNRKSRKRMSTWRKDAIPNKHVCFQQLTPTVRRRSNALHTCSICQPMFHIRSDFSSTTPASTLQNGNLACFRGNTIQRNAAPHNITRNQTIALLEDCMRRARQNVAFESYHTRGLCQLASLKVMSDFPFDFVHNMITTHCRLKLDVNIARYHTFYV